jgi:hypothetical protein
MAANDMLDLGNITLSPTNSSCSPYDSKSYAVVAAVSAGLAFFSILLILGVIWIIILFKKWRHFGQRLILYMSIAALLLNVAIILHRVDYNNQTSDFYTRFCQFGAYIDQTTNWMLLLAVSAIIVHSSFIIFSKKRSEKYELVYILAIFVFPLTFSWIPFIKDSYGRAGAWCWIRNEVRETCERFGFGAWLQFALWFAPLYIIMIVMGILYVVILVKIYRVRKTTANQLQESTIKRDLLSLIAYPFIYFLLNIFPFINRTYNLNRDEPSLALWYLAALANPSLGAWIVLAFTLDPGTRKRLTIVNIKAAVRELLGFEQTVVKEYEVGGKETIDTHNSNMAPPYKSYEDAYKLNLGSV